MLTSLITRGTLMTSATSTRRMVIVKREKRPSIHIDPIQTP